MIYFFTMETFFSFISKLLMFPGNQSFYCNYLLTKYSNIIIIKIILFNLFNNIKYHLWHPLYGCLFSIFRTIYNLCSRGTKVFQQSRNDIYFRIITTLFLIFLYQYFSIYSCALSFVSENSFMIFFIVSSLLTLNFFDILIVPLISPS